MNLKFETLEQAKKYNKLNWDLKTINRFWAKVDIPDDMNTDECWIWNAAKIKQGYGTFRLDGKNMLSHRLMYECYNNVNIEGFVIRHTCDNTKCVNPYHLLVGTQQDNMNDMFERGRENKIFGENHGNALLTDNSVKEILNYLILNKYTQLELSKKYNISISVINYISNGNSWKRIYNQLTENQKDKIKYNAKFNSINIKPNGENHYRTTLTEKEIKEIFNHLILNTFTQIELSKKYNVSEAVINNISNAKSWKYLYDQLTENQKEKIKSNAKFNSINIKPNGENHGNALLTEKDVKEIRKSYSDGNITQQQLSKKFNVKTPAIWKIIHRKTWKYI